MKVVELSCLTREDLIFIASIDHCQEIYLQLVNQLGVPEENILCFNQFPNGYFVPVGWSEEKSSFPSEVQIFFKEHGFEKIAENIDP